MHAVISFIAQYFVIIPPVLLASVYIQMTRFQKIQVVLRLVLGAAITIALIKLATSLHSDPRPFTHPGVTAYFQSSTDNGFPSDHTAFSALIGFVALYYSRKLGLALLALALLIGVSRVISKVHHTQDIIGGFVLAGVSYFLAVGLLVAVRKHRH